VCACIYIDIHVCVCVCVCVCVSVCVCINNTHTHTHTRDKNAERQVEVDECLRNNLANPHIRHLHVLTETAMDLTHFSKGKGDKLVQYVQGNWLTYRDVVGMCVCVCVLDTCVCMYNVILHIPRGERERER
jgi:hypothetical protein